MTDLPFLFALAAVLAADAGLDRDLGAAPAPGPGRAPWPAPRCSCRSPMPAMSDLLSRPKPVGLEWWLDQADEATVLGAPAARGRRASISGCSSRASRAARLPPALGPAGMAEQLQQAPRGGRAERHPGADAAAVRAAPSTTASRKFYALPQPALPDKPNRKGEEPAFYQRPGEEA